MCELLAIVSNRRVGFGLSWAGLQMGAERNPDGWGAGWLYEERFKVKKGAERIPAGRVGRALVQGVRSDTFIGHIRFKVQGERTLANTQPFIGDDRRSVFAGTMQSCLGRRGLRARVGPRLKGETGPEVLYQLLLTAYEDQGLQGIRDVVGEVFARRAVSNNASASFVLCIGGQVLIFRHQKPMYFCSRRKPFDANRVYLRGSQHHRFELTLAGAKHETDLATIVATEPLTGEHWRKVENRTLFAMSPTGLEQI
jgi:predicted glutamine amidotransferase